MSKIQLSSPSRGQNLSVQCSILPGPEACFQAMLALISKVQANPITTVHFFPHTFRSHGHLHLVVQHARLHLRPLQAWLASVCSPSCHHLNSVLTVLVLVLASLDLCVRSLSHPSTISIPNFERIRSKLGGAHLKHIRTQCLWSQEELSLHVNISKLIAICLACQSYPRS